ncbi:NADP-dependent aldehyde dehydrogenase [Chitinophaga terrae (ex Kim and Jung 2007)]|uniref:NADP-dependent aldehyde dehydrogenase n=1 Tax=Chitinophaga terrae (ex Kim and Jung 2007) TaxID=408074 RepID=A0A1H4GAT7_9BACT|nr:aldehyde dehydrogenase (NADP(+)) [Chitinophaga terrae (ex Kim and Jung 2007)]GEP93178.1 2,5-dioxovalerate dehydrogenase [Chitinophaga terrae (ex Kim and Jung 2007)]SEB06120.1 NADP-dependent aldehyde dehydrogenase [Chitinophaga terrae (ex Kim and Jung 2007)]
MSTGLQLIGNNYSGEGANTFRAFNPRLQEWIATEFREATSKEIDQALELASKAFPVAKKITPANRAKFLHAITEEIMALGDELLNTAANETGLPLARLQGERDRTTGQLKLFADLIAEGSWVNARINTGTPDTRQMQIPLGVIGIFGASNFPLAFSVAGGDTAAALAAGCTVVFKAHPAHPHTSHLVGTAIIAAAKRTGMPEGIFSLIHGASNETGQYLAAHPAVAALAFTGSFRGGKALYETATRRPTPIPVYAEMGSVNPVFFLPGILAEKGNELAAQFLQSVTLGVGQFCTNPGLFLTVGKAAELVDQLKDKIAGQQAGYMLTSGILKAYQEGISQLKKEGAELIGAAPEAAHQANAHLLQVSVGQALAKPEICGEVFGPSSVHITASGKEELYRFASSLEGQLTATIHGTTADLEEYAPLIDILREKAGRLIINGFPTGVAVNHSMVHGGPWPACTPAAGTSVGTMAIYRFCRPVCFQDFPEFLLPDELKNGNPMGIWRFLNGDFTKATC